MKSYVLLTAARNEAAYIEKTIQSVIAQTVLPARWVIVSDGSVDRTDEIVTSYAERHGFMLLVRRSAGQERHFGSKAEAIRAGYEQVKALEFEYVGNLDADVSFDPDYYEGVLEKLEANSRLGIAGGVRLDYRDGAFRPVQCARNSVGGPFQMFRRQCFEEIGGYLPLRFGGVDAVAEAMARSCGWEVESFPEFVVYHHRATGTAGGGILQARLKQGYQDFVLGTHPLFEAAKCASRLPSYPPIIGSVARFGGYSWAWLNGFERAVPDSFVRYLRAEQLARLRSAVLRPGRSA